MHTVFAIASKQNIIIIIVINTYSSKIPGGIIYQHCFILTSLYKTKNAFENIKSKLISNLLKKRSEL